MYRPQDPNNGSVQSFHLSSATSGPFQNHGFEFSPFSASTLAGPSPQSGLAQHLTPRFPQSSPGFNPSHRRNLSNDSHIGSMGPPSNTASPRLMASALPRTSSSLSSHQPTDRSLPNRQVTSETIEEAYVAFILYCNPKFPLDVDTTTLRTNFNSPPKSDNKEFETYRLYELIARFNAKEIKTWTQLALELGVEPPDVSKGQSVQKVQQYSVRLKRWMRAMHVDAFFEFLQGNEHRYFAKIPHPSDPYPAEGRDGVAAEEDLAIRALDPSFRPKRGRRRNSENEADEEAEAEHPNKQARMMDPNQFPPSAAPMSAAPLGAHPGGFHDPWAAASAVTPQSFAPWANKPMDPQSAYTSGTPSQLRWQLQRGDQDPSTPHPMSARPTSMAAHIDAAFDEPKSAVTPAGRKRRKHGPVVSSAWPSAVGSGAKPRGRPPATRNVQDGPYGTFPANPSQGAMPPTSVPSIEDPSDIQAQEAVSASIPQPQTRQAEPLSGRRGPLTLQVPPHTGPPVRLATPPRLLVNGETSTTTNNNNIHNNNNPLRPPSPPRTQIIEAPPQPQTPPTRPRKIHAINPNLSILEREIPGFAFEALKRVLSSDLLRADLVNRRTRLSGDEAKRLAQTILDRLKIPRRDTDESKDDIARLTAASWLGLGEQLRVPLGPAMGGGKRLRVVRFRVDEEGYEEVVSDDDDQESADDGSEAGAAAAAAGKAGKRIREVFDLSWSVSMGGCSGSFEMKGLALAPAPSEQGAAAAAAGEDAEPRYEDTHDFIIRSWTDAVQQYGLNDHWASRAVTRAGDKPSEFSATTLRKGGLDREDGDAEYWKAKCMELRFGINMAKGEFQRIRDRLVERVLDVLI